MTKKVADLVHRCRRRCCRRCRCRSHFCRNDRQVLKRNMVIRKTFHFFVSRGASKASRFHFTWETGSSLSLLGDFDNGRGFREDERIAKRASNGGPPAETRFDADSEAELFSSFQIGTWLMIHFSNNFCATKKEINTSLIRLSDGSPSFKTLSDPVQFSV